jgi:hypothetical protein
MGCKELKAGQWKQKTEPETQPLNWNLWDEDEIRMDWKRYEHVKKN